MKIVIVGAGIGGLTAALAFSGLGHAVTLLESAAEIDDVGAGIQISPNALKVLDALGVGEGVRRTAFRPRALEMCMGRSGREVFTVPITDAATTDWGAEYLHLHRPDLIAALLEKARSAAEIRIVLGQRVAGFSQSPESIVVRCADGTVIDADLLVGADGIRSAVREQMLGKQQPNFTGNAAWRLVVPTESLGDHAPPPTACVWVGAGRHAVTYRLRGGALSNFVGVVEQSDWAHESWTDRGTKAQALADFAGWHPTIETMINKAQEHYRWALFDREPLPHWSEGRAVLLGDACHPTLPFLAQGAAMAIEDGFILAQEVSARDEAELPNALSAYFDRRIARVSAVQRGSRANMGRFHRKSRLSQLATYGPMHIAGRLMPSAILHQMNWLYRYDATDATGTPDATGR